MFPLFIIPFYYMWQFIHTQSKTFVSEKRARNINSFLHSISISLLLGYNSTFTVSIALPLSISYFIIDTLYIISNSLKNESLFIYHHLVCLYMYYNIYQDKYSSILLDMIYIGELSNFFNYIIYDFIQQKKEKTFIYRIVRYIQWIWFSYFRLIHMTFLAYTYYFKIYDSILRFNLLLIYYMGIVWSFKQYKQIMNQKKVI